MNALIPSANNLAIDGGMNKMSEELLVSAAKVASGHREILPQTTESWNGKPYAHYPTGQPQLTTLKLTIEPHIALPWHTHPFPNVVHVLSGTLTLHEKVCGKTQVVHRGRRRISRRHSSG